MQTAAQDGFKLGATLNFAITDVPHDEWHKVFVQVDPSREGEGPYAGYMEPTWPAGWVNAEEEAERLGISLRELYWSREVAHGQVWREATPAWEGIKPCIYGSQHNGVVNLGLQMALDLLSGVTAPHILQDIGIASDTSTVTATTVHLGGAAAVITSGGTQNGFLRAYSPAASRSNQVLTCGATFTQADMAGATFVIHKVGLLNDTADAGTGLGAGPAVGIFDVIGGTGGAAPFNQPFTIDLTGVTSWTLLMQIQVTAANS